MRDKMGTSWHELTTNDIEDMVKSGEREIERRKVQSSVRAASSYSVEEKIEIFDSIHGSLEDYVTDVVRGDKVDDHAAIEELLSIMFTVRVFNAFK
jgi:hypothetical protein